MMGWDAGFSGCTRAAYRERAFRVTRGRTTTLAPTNSTPRAAKSGKGGARRPSSEASTVAVGGSPTLKLADAPAAVPARSQSAFQNPCSPWPATRRIVNESL